MAKELEQKLFSERTDRLDVQSYVDSQLLRQRDINARIVAFTRPVLPQNAMVLDACSGPEGSLLAARERGYRWVGNDIVRAFGDSVRRSGESMVLSDISRAPFRNDSFDGVLFVFGLDNLYAPEAAIAEAVRICKPGGAIVEAEPGIPAWTGKIIMHSLLQAEPGIQTDFFADKHIHTEIAQQFRGKPYTEQEYVEAILSNQLGISQNEATDSLVSLIDAYPKSKVFFRFSLYLTEHYFRHIDTIRSKFGLEVVRAGVAFMGKKEDDHWEVAGPFDVPHTQWVEHLLEGKKWNQEMSEVKEASIVLGDVRTRIVLPVVVFQK